MADGEPPDRHVTKIGGLPYRAASAEWPTRKNGAPFVFLAQFDFSDSKDLTGELPADLLLVFADNANHPEHLHFEWQPLRLSGLVEAQGIPEAPVAVDPSISQRQDQFLQQLKAKFQAFGMDLPVDVDKAYEQTNALAPCHGYIFRTASFPQARPRDDTGRYPICRGKEVSSEYHLLQYQATQIGSAPFFVQEGDPGHVTGRLLCTLSSVQSAVDVDFPWINQQAPIPLRKRNHAGNKKYLMIGDLGCVRISIDHSGRVHGNGSWY